MSQLSELEKKAGRLVVGRLPGSDVPEEYVRAFQSGGLGGVTLFRENCLDLKQLSNLVAGIYEHSYHSPVVTVDQEGGAVQRFDRALGSIPSAMAYAACPDREIVRSVFSGACRQLKLLGINILLAPVLDVLTNPINPIVSTRSYGSIPGLVERCAREMIEIISEAGLVPVGKHFPGHGATSEDSHLSLAVSHVSSERLWSIDLAPFKNCLEVLPAILTGHLWIKCVDEEALPASLSPRVIEGILKEYLKFDGLVITDDLTMKGLTDSSSLSEASVLALLAGNDLLLVCGDLEKSNEARDALVKAVKDGRVLESRLDEAIARLDRVLPERPELNSLPGKCSQSLGQLTALSEATSEDSDQIARMTATYLRGSSIAFKDSDWVVVAPDHPRYALDLTKHLKCYSDAKYGESAPSIEDIRYPLQPEFDIVKATADRVRGKNCIFVTFRCLLNEGQLQLGQMIADQCARKIAVCPDTPFDFEGLPDWPVILATFDPSDRAIKGLAQALAEESLSSKANFYFSRLMEGVSVINRNKIVQ